MLLFISIILFFTTVKYVLKIIIYYKCRIAGEKKKIINKMCYVMLHKVIYFKGI